MCLSDVYEGENLLCKNIQNVHIEDGKLVFIDVMGIRYEADAHIKDIDLIDNVIRIEA